MQTRPVLARALSTTASPPRVHVLGLGSIGTFAAHCLAEMADRPATTLLLHRPSLVDAYTQNGNNIILKTLTGQSIARGGYDFEVLHNARWYPINPDHGTPTIHPDQGTPTRNPGPPTPTTTHIANLIVCVKSTQTVAALRPLLSRLSRDSTILFLQNGAGMIEQVNRDLWPDPDTQPSYMTGVISHGVGLNRSFDITHTGPSATSIGPVPRREALHPDTPPASPLSSSPSYMLENLPLIPRLNCKSYAWPDILQIQLEKLAVNALSNPLCALADSITAYLFTIPDTCRALMEEISTVILALPELQGVPGVAARFSARALESTVMDIIERNRETTCSMVWDMRAGRETEIRYINGYWARRGREVGVPTPINDDLVARVEAKTAQISNTQP